MKIQTNNLCFFQVLSDVCPDPTTTLRRIFFDYVVDSKGRFMTSDNKILETSFPKISELYDLLNKICKEKIDSIWLQYWSKSSRKRLSNMVESMLMFFGLTMVDDYYTISRIGTAKLIDVIYGRFYDKWNNLYNLYQKPYDALSPYQVKKNIKTVIDKMTNNSNIKSDLDRVLTDTGNINYGKVVSEIKNGNKTITKAFNSAIEMSKAGSERHDTTDDSVQSIEPFNATAMKDTDKTYTTNSDTLSFTDRKDKEQHSGTDTEGETYQNYKTETTDSGKDTTEKTINQTDGKTVASDYERSNEFEQNIQFEGNIGNITLQELIKQERDKITYQIFDTLYQDIDSVLVRKSYKI